MTKAMRIVVMGVSGSGKSAVGAALADALGVPFVEGDALHPRANVQKMAAGIPLTDADRAPWLAAIGARLAEHEQLVVACSALRRRYRDAIRAHAEGVRFALLQVAPGELTRRVAHRPGHFMPPTLLESQLAALEPLGDDEAGVTVPSMGSPARTAREIIAALGDGPAATSGMLGR